MRNTGPRLACVAALYLAFAVFSGARAQDSAVRDEGSFEAGWVVTGVRQPIGFTASRVVFSFQLEGRVNIRTDEDLLVDLWSRCVGLSDSETGSTARCVWRHPGGDEIYSVLSGRLLDRGGSAARGRFVGGTGRYAGIEGEYSFTSWSSLQVSRGERTREYLERDAPTIQAFTDNLRGTWRIR